MQGSGPIRVLILYVHPLLGEGLAKLLAAEPGIDADAIAMSDAPGVTAALADRPHAVIIERREEPSMVRRAATGLPGALAATEGLVGSMASGHAAPLLLFVDIQGAAAPSGADGDRSRVPMARPAADDLERVVHAVRDLRRRQPALVGA